MNIAKLQFTKPFMPPFAGTAEDVEALIQMLGWVVAESPESWPLSDDRQTLRQIDAWLGQARPHPLPSGSRH